VERSLRAHLPHGQFEGTTPRDSRTMQAVRGRNNRTTEKRLRFGLVRRGVVGWQVQPGGLMGKPDFFFPARNVAVFVDGCFWHGCPECGHVPRKNVSFWRAKIGRNRYRDRIVDAELEQQGIRVLRFWEHELDLGLGACIKKVIACLKEPPIPERKRGGTIRVTF